MAKGRQSNGIATDRGRVTIVGARTSNEFSILLLSYLESERKIGSSCWMVFALGFSRLTGWRRR